MDNIQDKKFIEVIEEMKMRDAVDPVPEDSAGYVTVSVEKSAAEGLLGHPFDPKSTQDTREISEAMDSGELIYALGYAPTEGTSRYLTPFDGMGSDKIVVSSNKSNNAVSVIEGGNIKRITQDNSDGSGKDTQYDPNNTHPYSELDIDEDATGKITAAQLKLDGQNGSTADFSSVGQVLGSALGRALAPDNQFVQLAAGTVIGAVGQKLAQVFAASLTTNGATFDLSRTFADFNVSIAGAGASSVASFLVAELGTALNFPGFGGQLFNAAAGGFAGSVASQIATKMVGTASAAGVSFDAAIATLDFASAATNAAYGVSALFGSLLGQQLEPAQTHEGAVGGQLLGAVGSAVGISAALSGALGTVLGFIAPGIGSLIGTILGTLIGDAFGNVPHPAAVDLLDQAGTLYAATHYQVSATDGGDYSTPDQLVVPALAIINAYLGAVKGAALDHYNQVTLGYQANPLFYIEGVPGHPAIGTFLNPNDAVQAAALAVLQNTEVIGGDLLMKRAHQNSSSNHPLAAAPGDPSGDPGPTGTDTLATAAEQLAIMSGDLALAQDYENYLNNREAINALMAVNPNSAFTAGWIATFARVNELGLNHVNASDFLGGLVGFLDSVHKAGLAEASNVSVKHGGGASIVIEIRVAGGVDVPGALSVFADQTNEISDATGKTVQFVFANGLGPVGFHGLGPAQTSGDGGNDLWFGADGPNNFNASASTNAILVGGAGSDTLVGGIGRDFLDGGAGNDALFGGAGDDILRGGKANDTLYGGAGNDTYVFDRGDGADVAIDIDGADALVFGAGISLADISVFSSGGDLIVGVKDPAHPGVPFGQLVDRITLQNWADPLYRVENLRFADGTTLNIAAALATAVPFGETLSASSVVENSPVGTAVGTVTGFDLNANAGLSYSLVDSAGGRFAINASTGVLSAAVSLDYEAGHSWQVTARVSDGAHVFDKAFTINVTDVNEAPSNAVLSGGSVAENSANGTIVGTVTGTDPDAGAVLHYALTDNAGGRFAINPSSGVVTVANGALLDYETATSWQIGVRTADQYGLYFDKPFTIAVTDVYEGPFGFDPSTFRLAAFAAGAGGWTDQNHYPREVADVNGDGMADIVGFANDGVVVSLATGNENFATPTYELATFAINAGGWANQNLYPRLLGDVNGDGMADIVGFEQDGVAVSLATGNGHFATPTGELATFAIGAGGWSSQDSYPRLLGDVNGDGMADIVGFEYGGVAVSLATGNGHFASPTFELASFAINAGGWSSQDFYPRLLGDVNGDGMADIVGFGAGGVIVSLATGNGHFASPIGETATFGFLAGAGGWTSQTQYPRLLADVNGDRKDDIVGFGADMVMVSLATGGGQFAAPVPGIRNFTGNAGGWASQNLYPRDLGDVNGDGVADIIGFGQDGVFEALSNGFYHINHAPVVSLLAGANLVANAGQVMQASSLFSATDADGDPLSYVIYDNTISSGGGHFMLNGAAVPSDTGVALTTAQFAQLTFVAGAAGSSSDLNVAAYDGHVYTGWGEVHVNVNHAPVVSLLAGANVVANAGQSLQASSLFHATDADGDPLSYVIYDNTISSGGGHFMLNGVTVQSDTGVPLTAAQFAQLTFVAGAAGSSSDLNVTAYDGRVYSSWGEVHVHVNHAPVLTVLSADITANPGQVLQASSLFSASDADGDALTFYFEDDTAAANSGYFMLNGTPQAQGAGLGVNAAQLATVTFVTGSVNDNLSMQLADDKGAVSEGIGFHLHVNHAPVLTVLSADITANPGQVLQASSLFSASDADGDALTFYFEDDTAAANSGYFMLNGTPQAQGAGFGVNAAQLATVTFVTGSVNDNLSMQLADDKGAVSASIGFRLHVNHAPAVGLLDSSALVANSGQVMQASSLFHATDADGDPLSYLIYDNTISSGGGHFMLNGVAVQSDVGVSLTAAQFAQLTFVAGAAESSSDLNVEAYDGRVYSDWGEIHIAVAPAGGTLVNNSSGTSTLTITDSADNHSWASFASTFSQPDGHGSLLWQTGVNDGGSTWWNVFDTSDAWSFNHYTSVFTPSGQLVTQTVTNDDGTHYLLANDPSNAYGWSTFTMTFDSGWNVTSIVDVTNDDGTHTVDTGQILASLDTLTWYSNSYVVTLDKAVNPQGDGMPVILDLDGNGIDITPLDSSTAAFDMDGRAGREHTAWAGGKDGFLAIDLGPDGKSGPDGVIDQAAEIVFTQWSPTAVSDMAALRDVFDTNHNGSLDPGDARWDDFRIWQDANADGFSQAGEVRTLDALGISSIGLDPAGPSQRFYDGSAIHGFSSFTRTDGTTGIAGDVSLEYQTIADPLYAKAHHDWHVA
jgi:hypothetical protein